MKVDVKALEDAGISLLFAATDYEADELNALYKLATSLQDEREEAVRDIRAEKGVGLTLVVNPPRLAFILRYLSSADSVQEHTN